MVDEAKLTYDDYARCEREGKVAEVLDGRLHNHPAPGLRHQLVVTNLFRILDPMVRETSFGAIFIAPFDVLLSPHDILEPDLLLVLRHDFSRLTERGLEGPPELVIEVISEWSEPYDRSTKKARYAQLGVPNLWIVDPYQKTIETFSLKGGVFRMERLVREKESFDPPEIPGLLIKAEDVFRPL